MNTILALSSVVYEPSVVLTGLKTLSCLIMARIKRGSSPLDFAARKIIARYGTGYELAALAIWPATCCSRSLTSGRCFASAKTSKRCVASQP